MSNGIKQVFFFFSVVLSVALIAFIWFKISDRKAREAILKAKIDFTPLKRESFLSSRVDEIYCPQDVRCSTPPVWIILEGHKKISIDADIDVENKFTFLSIISVGDSLAKKEGSDTLFVFEDEKVRKFLLKFILE